ncbi:MAG: TetR/AcrR family transcriptional regulator [Acidobacteriota bacterium]|jgi:AcrR family transcriptional regulator
MKNARDAIAKSALHLFAEKGYAGCSIREICEKAGVTKPVLYYHFRNKEHLYQELMLDIFNGTRKNLVRLEKSPGSIRERLEKFVSAEFEDTKKDPSEIKLVFRMMFSPEEGYPYFNFVEEYLRERKIIADCIGVIDRETGTLTDPETSATAIMGMMLMLILEYLFTGKKTLTRRKAKEITNYLLPSKLQ